MEPADSIGHVDEAGFADAYDDEGDSFLPPQRDLDRMKLGKSLSVCLCCCRWHSACRFVAFPGVDFVVPLRSMVHCVHMMVLFVLMLRRQLAEGE